ncbi:MAG: hypothetical protein KA436_02325 [Oligoflexales bacterium]|nr:hypothetical protein [Oligoflexales bacterium]
MTRSERRIHGIGVFRKNEQVALCYAQANLGNENLLVAESPDGLHFSCSEHTFNPQLEHALISEWSNVHHLNVAHIDDFYVGTAMVGVGSKQKLLLMKSYDLDHWSDISFSSETALPLLLASDFYWEGAYLGFSIRCGVLEKLVSSDLKNWSKLPEQIVLAGADEVAEPACVFTSNYGLFVVFNVQSSSHAAHSYETHIALLDHETLSLKWRSHKPLWKTSKESDAWSPIGAVFFNNGIYGYWNLGQQGIRAIVYPNTGIPFSFLSGKTISMSKAPENPLISPKNDQKQDDWQSFATFNPAAFFADGRVHILFRAQGDDLISRIGYATSSDGVHIDERFNTPVFSPSELPILKATQLDSSPFSSGGGIGGCEDPRATVIDKRVYVTYVSYDGATPPRLALTSIALEDFLDRRWFWEKPVLISPPGIVDKSGVIFPEKVNGKFVVLHRIFPNIQIDYLDHLHFDGTFWLEGKAEIQVRPGYWDSRKIGAGAPPVKTREGWLLIYYGVDDLNDKTYNIGAMLLDLNDPSKVLFRTNIPIITPSDWYENVGFKPGIVYPCGAIVLGSQLFVYYGAADSVVCVATANLETFLAELKSQNTVNMDKAILKKVRGL